MTVGYGEGDDLLGWGRTEAPHEEAGCQGIQVSVYSLEVMVKA